VGLVIILAATWIMVLTTVVLDFAGFWRRRTGWRWQGIGILIMNGVTLADSYAGVRSGQFTVPVILIGLALLIFGLCVQGRDPRRPRHARRYGE
jgi:hypothetical protein